jgi:hypothetical protein
METWSTLRTSIWPCLLLALLVCGAVSGCSDRPKAYPAAGVVVYADGAPLQDGRIEVRSAEHPYTARGSVDREGRFQLTTFKTNDGAIAGKHQVLIIQRFTADIDDIAKHAEHASQMRRLDQKYSSYKTSPLELTIDPKGDNTNIRLVVED